MFANSRINLFNFDIYSRRISFFYNTREKIGSIFGFILTMLYVFSTITLFLIYMIRTINRTDVKVNDSTMHAQGLPSIDINPDILYFAFGLENPITLNRYIDETIYSPLIRLIKREKENGSFVTKTHLIIKPKRCNVTTFGEKYKDLFVENELDNSYCLGDYNFTLSGGFKYEEISYIRIEIQPCVNSSDNNNHCQPQNIIDSYLTSAYFSMHIKDIGLNPLNYSSPIIPILQNLYTTIDKSMKRDFLIYFGITEIHTDIGLLENIIRKQRFLQFKQFQDPFFFMDEEEYHSGANLVTLQLRLYEYIKIQTRTYTKLSEIFSIIGGYMKLIYTIFTIMTLLTKNIVVEKKLLNSLFNFNISQKKIILSIRYERRLNYLIHNDKGDFNSFIPFVARKSMKPYKKYTKQTNNSKCDNSFGNLMQKSVTDSMKLKSNEMKLKKNYSDKQKFQLSKQIEGKNININNSKMEKDEFNSQNNIVYFKKNRFSYYNHNKKEKINSKSVQETDHDIDDLSINILNYFCNIGKSRKKTELELFNSGVNFYRNQLNIIHFFNIIFLTEIMLNQQYDKQSSILNQTIEIQI